jgi:hypothetical protein
MAPEKFLKFAQRERPDMTADNGRGDPREGHERSVDTRTLNLEEGDVNSKLNDQRNKTAG